MQVDAGTGLGSVSGYLMKGKDLAAMQLIDLNACGVDLSTATVVRASGVTSMAFSLRYDDSANIPDTCPGARTRPTRDRHHPLGERSHGDCRLAHHLPDAA